MQAFLTEFDYRRIEKNDIPRDRNVETKFFIRNQSLPLSPGRPAMPGKPCNPIRPRWPLAP